MNNVTRVSSAEFVKEVRRYQDAALIQPVIITSQGRDQTVMISAEEYYRLKNCANTGLYIDDVPEDDVEAVRRAQDICRNSRLRS